MRTTFRFALLATVAAYMLIFTGGLVRVSGAGLGCPDWPRCFGRWIPPTSISQLPPDVDPAKFNFTLAWIEYLNRLFGVIVGLLILITAILALQHFRKVPRIIIPSVLAALLVAYTGWQGGWVVQSELNTTLVSVHAIFAILIACLMIYATQNVYYVINPKAEKGSNYPKGLTRWLASLWGLSLIQVVLGTNVRSTVETLRENQMLAAGLEWFSQAGGLNHLHIVLGLLITLYGIYLARRVVSESGSASTLVWQSGWGLLILMAGQLCFGLLLIFTGLPPLLEVLHLWTASLIVGALLLLYLAFRKSREGLHEQS